MVPRTAPNKGAVRRGKAACGAGRKGLYSNAATAAFAGVDGAAATFAEAAGVILTSMDGRSGAAWTLTTPAPASHSKLIAQAAPGAGTLLVGNSAGSMSRRILWSSGPPLAARARLGSSDRCDSNCVS